MQAKSFENSPRKDFNLVIWKESNEQEDECVEKFFSERVVSEGPCPLASREMVNHVALSRLYQLLKYGRGTLKGIFSYKELTHICDARPVTWCEEDMWGDRSWDMANAVFYEFMDEKEYDKEIEVLFDKLQALDKFQRFVLTDVWECAMRSKKDPMAYVLNEIG